MERLTYVVKYYTQTSRRFVWQTIHRREAVGTSLTTFCARLGRAKAESNTAGDSNANKAHYGQY
jgi:hypothetical protein